MTRTFYGSVLRLYPAAYRDAFGKEMIETHIRAAAECRGGGVFARMIFSVRELAGLALGSVSEWTARWAAPDTYVTSRCHVRTASGPPSEMAELRAELDCLIRAMEDAIAHHDFPKARLYSDAERVIRRKLERLISDRGLPSNRIPA